MASVLNGLPMLDGVLPKTSIAMCRQRGSIHTDQIVTGTGTRSGTGPRMIGETVVVTLFENVSVRETGSRTDDAAGPLSYVGTPSFAAIAVLLVAAVENVSARETGSMIDDAAGVGLAIECGTTPVTVKGTGPGTEAGIEKPEIAHRAVTVETAVQVDAVSSGNDSRTKSSGSQPRTKDSPLRPWRPAAHPQLGRGQLSLNPGNANKK